MGGGPETMEKVMVFSSLASSLLILSVGSFLQVGRPLTHCLTAMRGRLHTRLHTYNSDKLMPFLKPSTLALGIKF